MARIVTQDEAHFMGDALEEKTRTHLYVLLAEYSHRVDALREYGANGHDWPRNGLSAMFYAAEASEGADDPESQFTRTQLFEEVKSLEAFIKKYEPLIKHAEKALKHDGRPMTITAHPCQPPAERIAY